MSRIQFYKIDPQHRENRGEKYFQVCLDSDTVLQVCVSPSTEYRRGRSNTIGIFLIDKLNFLANYFAYGYVQTCTRGQFVKQFDKIVELLRPTTTNKRR